MTLADILRKYFERRREICDQKTRYLTLGNNVSQFYPYHDQDDIGCRVRNVSYFSNDLDSRSKKESLHKGGFTINKKGISRRKRMTVLPNGAIEYETVTKDSDGNEKIQTVRQKGHELFVTTKGRKPSGEELVDEKVIDVSHLKDIDDIFKYIDENYPTVGQNHFENDQSKTPFSDSRTELENLQEHLSKLLGENFENFQASDKPNSLFEDFRLPDFPMFDDSIFKEDKRKLFKDVEPEVGRLYNVNPKKNQMRKEMEKFMNKMASPSIFESFDKNAMIEIPDEKTPLDKFVELDEDTKNGMLALRRENDKIIDKLDRYFSNPSHYSKNDIYSDIDDSKSVDAQLILPDRESRVTDYSDLGDIFRKSFAPNHQFRNLFPYGGIESQQVFVDSGKVRIVSMKKDQNGHEEKTVTYKIGDKQYSVKTVRDKSGREIKKEKNLNFPEEELPNFKKQWHENFHSDFKD